MMLKVFSTAITIMLCSQLHKLAIALSNDHDHGSSYHPSHMSTGRQS